MIHVSRRAADDTYRIISGCARQGTAVVASVGVDLRLRERYRHDRFAPFPELPRHIGGYDVGIAPLADIPCNWARSDIKLKEYAASAVPWLASPIGPYLGLGKAQGGRLVYDDEWFEALDFMVAHPFRRLWLARKAKKWAQAHSLDAVVSRWEGVFAAAVDAKGAADSTSRASTGDAVATG